VGPSPRLFEVSTVMELVVRKNDLLRELQLFQGIVERKNTIPILANVLIEADGDQVKLLATDLEVGLRSRCQASVSKKGSLTLPAKKFCEIVKSLPRENGNDHVFIGPRAGGLSNMAMAALLERMDRTDITVHGFRSTFRDWAAERTGHANHVVEMALAHVVGNKVEAAYRRGDLFEKRRRLMADWAQYCLSRPAAEGERVVILRRVAQ